MSGRRLNPEEMALLEAAARDYFAAVMAVQLGLGQEVAEGLSAEQAVVATKGTALNMAVQGVVKVATESSGNTLEMFAHVGGAMAALLANLNASNAGASGDSAAVAFNLGFDRMAAQLAVNPPPPTTLQ